jgi:hypothetical protein
MSPFDGELARRIDHAARKGQVVAMHSVQFTCGGIAHWGVPVGVEPGMVKVAFEAQLGQRLAFEGGPTIFLKTRFVGLDDIAADGTIPGGFGFVEAQDADGDFLYGRVDWSADGGADFAGRGELWGGRFTFSSGTGKWHEAHGEINAKLWAVPQHLDAAMPPTEPIMVYAFLEGDGALDTPGLAFDR